MVIHLVSENKSIVQKPQLPKLNWDEIDNLK